MNISSNCKIFLVIIFSSFLPGILNVNLQLVPTSVNGTGSRFLWIFSLCLLDPTPETWMKIMIILCIKTITFLFYFVS